MGQNVYCNTFNNILHSVCLMVRPSVRPSDLPDLSYLSVRLTVCTFRPSICLFVRSSVCSCVRQSVRPSVCSSVRPSVPASVSPSVRPFVRSVRSSAPASVRPSVHISVPIIPTVGNDRDHCELLLILFPYNISPIKCYISALRGALQPPFHRRRADAHGRLRRP